MKKKIKLKGHLKNYMYLLADAYYFAGMHERADVFCK